MTVNNSTTITLGNSKPKAALLKEARTTVKLFIAFWAVTAIPILVVWILDILEFKTINFSLIYVGLLYSVGFVIWSMLKLSNSIRSITLNNHNITMYKGFNNQLLPELTPQQIDRIVITRKGRIKSIFNKKLKNDNQVAIHTLMAEFEIAFNTDFNYLITIELHPKTASERSILGYKIFSKDFDNLTPLFEWFRYHRIAVEYGLPVG